jgi:hypothetical protein
MGLGLGFTDHVAGYCRLPPLSGLGTDRLSFSQLNFISLSLVLVQ